MRCTIEWIPSEWSAQIFAITLHFVKGTSELMTRSCTDVPLLGAQHTYAEPSQWRDDSVGWTAAFQDGPLAGTIVAFVAPDGIRRWLVGVEPRAWLAPSELGVLLNCRSLDRVSGLLASKLALAILRGTTELNGIVIAHEHAAPVEEFMGIRQSTSLSIAHSRGWGVAAAADACCRLGVDVEHQRPSLQGFELDREFLVVETPEPTTALLDWVAAEASAKAFGSGNPLRYLRRRDAVPARNERTAYFATIYGGAALGLAAGSGYFEQSHERAWCVVRFDV